jgi:hypothetical protein
VRPIGLSLFDTGAQLVFLNCKSCLRRFASERCGSEFLRLSKRRLDRLRIKLDELFEPLKGFAHQTESCVEACLGCSNRLFRDEGGHIRLQRSRAVYRPINLLHRSNIESILAAISMKSNSYFAYPPRARMPA